jgi:valyl-tRNA synthetase
LMIDKYGADALRYTLITKMVGAGQNISFDYDRTKQESPSVETSRNFANKLWNASRFVMMNMKGKTPQDLALFPDGIPQGDEEIRELELCDQWLLSRFYQTVQQTKANIESYSLGEAAKGLYEFIWNDFCDWYIELVKIRLWQDETSKSRLVAQKTLGYVLEGMLKLLHPFMPHITEEIWQTLTQQASLNPPKFGGTVQTLALQIYPEVAELIDPDLETSFNLLFDTIGTIRNLRAESVIKPGEKIKVILQTESDRESDILKSTQSYIQDIAKVGELIITSNLTEDPGQVIAGVTGTVQILIPLTGLVDVAALQAKLQKKLDKVKQDIKTLTGRLNNPGFVNKAPAEVIEGANNDLAEAKKQAEILQERLDRLQ